MGADKFAPAAEVEKMDLAVNRWHRYIRESARRRRKNPTQVPDYSQQLRDIAAGLNRPQTPAWAIAIGAALIGFFGAVCAQMLRRIFDEWRDLRQVQRVVYGGLAGLFFALDNMRGAGSEREAKEELAATRHFDPDEFLRHEYRLFMQMPERYIVNDIYLELRKISNAPNSVRARSTHLMNLIAINIANNRFDPRLFRRALKKREAETFFRRVAEIAEPILDRRLASDPRRQPRVLFEFLMFLIGVPLRIFALSVSYFERVSRWMGQPALKITIRRKPRPPSDGERQRQSGAECGPEANDSVFSETRSGASEHPPSAPEFM